MDGYGLENRTIDHGSEERIRLRVLTSFGNLLYPPLEICALGTPRLEAVIRDRRCYQSGLFNENITLPGAIRVGYSMRI